ncbi:hypothetical protein QZH41_011124, partial [Actinostola sp. cb2023]
NNFSCENNSNDGGGGNGDDGGGGGDDGGEGGCSDGDDSDGDDNGGGNDNGDGDGGGSDGDDSDGDDNGGGGDNGDDGGGSVVMVMVMIVMVMIMVVVMIMMVVVVMMMIVMVMLMVMVVVMVMIMVDSFQCVHKCPNTYFQMEGQCVKECPAGYEAKKGQSRFSSGKCEKCINQRCPRICKSKSKALIDSISALRVYKGCTELVGDLVIQIRGGGGSISKDLKDNLGMLEKVKGYILIRESRSIVSLKFLKNLKTIEPRKTIRLLKDKVTGKVTVMEVPLLYNERYALTIMDNPQLETMWGFNPNLTITVGGVLVRMNPRLCPSKIQPLVNILKRTNTSSGRHIDISETTNGYDVACQVKTINLTVTEKVKPINSRQRCPHVCIEVKWNEVRINEDYRNVLFYTISYREAPHMDITEFDNIDGCSSKTVWKKVDVPANEPKPLNASDYINQAIPVMIRYIGSLKPHTLYAIYVEAVTLNKKGARSSLKFLKTREMVPSAVVGLDASYIDSQSLLVKWMPPLFPNGNITKYIVSYQESLYSVWVQDDLDWCTRQILPRRRSEDNNDKDKNKPGACNITCECNKDAVIVPEKQAAIFAKEFQDQLFKAIFTKEKDDNPTTKPTNVTTTPIVPTTPTVVNKTNCSSNAQEGACTTVPTSSSPSTPYANVTTGSSGVIPTTPTKAIPKVTREVNGTQGQLRISGLRHFADYTIVVCACTIAGCARDKSCSSTKGRTDKKGAGKEWDWEGMGLGRNGIGKEWDWEGMGLGRNGTGKEWDWEGMGLGRNGTGKEWDWEGKEWDWEGWDWKEWDWEWDWEGRNGTRKEWDWEGMGLGRNGTGKEWDWEGMGLGRNGIGKEWDC